MVVVTQLARKAPSGEPDAAARAAAATQPRRPEERAHDSSTCRSIFAGADGAGDPRLRRPRRLRPRRGHAAAARRRATSRTLMVASIGPFWDANETWLVLGVGILLVAFPLAHGIMLSSLYLPVALMLIGLILRGVAFEFRVKADGLAQASCGTGCSRLGSLVAGVRAGRDAGGRRSPASRRASAIVLFGLLVGAGLCGGYVLLGATWLILKTEGDLQATRTALEQGRRPAGGRRGRRDQPGQPVCERRHHAEVVRVAAHRCGSPRCRSPRRRRSSASGAALDAPAARAVDARMAAVRAGGLGVRVRLRRPGLQPVSLPGDGPHDDLAGRGRTRVAALRVRRRAASCCR